MYEVGKPQGLELLHRQMNEAGVEHIVMLGRAAPSL
jgi:hypothetical protein